MALDLLLFDVQAQLTHVQSRTNALELENADLKAEVRRLRLNQDTTPGIHDARLTIETLTMRVNSLKRCNEHLKEENKRLLEDQPNTSDSRQEREEALSVRLAVSFGLEKLTSELNQMKLSKNTQNAENEWLRQRVMQLQSKNEQNMSLLTPCAVMNDEKTQSEAVQCENDDVQNDSNSSSSQSSEENEPDGQGPRYESIDAPIQDQLNYFEIDSKYEMKPSCLKIIETQHDPTWEENYCLRRENGLITTSDLLWFALQIARAMQFLTEKKVLHRDVALRNVLLKSDFTLKVADFGLSRKLHAGDKAYQIWKHKIALPIRYMAPESLIAGRFSVHSECWSFGIVIWELFTFAIHQPYETELKNTDAKNPYLNCLLDYITSGQRLAIPSTAPSNLKNLMNDLWSEDPDTRPSFQTCRKIIRQELAQSCQKILTGERTALQALHASEVSIFHVENAKDKDKLTTISAKKQLFLRRFAFISIFAVLLIAAAFATYYVVGILMKSKEDSWNVNSTEVESITDLHGRNLSYVQLIPGVDLQSGLFCTLPDGAGAFLFLLDGSGSQNNIIFVDFKTEKKHSVQLVDNANYSKYIWKDVMAVTRSWNTIILSLVETVEQGRNKTFLLSWSTKNYEELSIIDQHEIRYSDAVNILTDKLHTPKVHHIVEDNKAKLFCFAYYYQIGLGFPELEMYTVFFVVEIDIDKSGIISSKTLFDKQSLKGLLLRPFLYLDALYWPVNPHTKSNGEIEVLSESMVKFPLNGSAMSKVPIANYRQCAWSNAVWTDWPVQIDGKVFYFIAVENGTKSNMCFIDFDHMSWATVQFDIGVHKTAPISTKMTISSDARKLFVNGIIESSNFYIAIIDFTAVKKLMDPFILPEKALVISHAVPDIKNGTNVQMYCVHPEGKRVYIFDSLDGSVRSSDLVVGSIVELENRVPVHDFCGCVILMMGICAIAHSSIPLLIIMTAETWSGKQKANLFTFHINDTSITFAQNISTGMNYINSDLTTKYNAFLEDEKGGMYFMIYWYYPETGELEKTHFDLLKIDLGKNYTIECKLLLKNQTINGRWFSPSIQAEDIFWLFSYPILIDENFLKISLKTGIQEKVKFSNKLSLLSDNFYSNVVGSMNGLTFISFHYNTLKADDIFYIDFSRKSWHKLQLAKNITVIQSSAMIPLRAASKEFFIFGNCMEQNEKKDICFDVVIVDEMMQLQKKHSP